uniref:Dynein light chain n=1 Tax=Ailuropoda melanoleuca TaxID=9646 RepID=A0A7N5P8N8_AILME
MIKDNSHLTQVEVDEVLCLVRYVAAEIPAHDAMPGGVVFLVEFLFDVRGNVLLYIVLLHRLSGTVNGVLLHVLRHVSVLDHSLSVRHGGPSHTGVWSEW